MVPHRTRGVGTPGHRRWRHQDENASCTASDGDGVVPRRGCLWQRQWRQRRRRERHGQRGSLTLSGQDFTEAAIMAAMYDQLLTNAGYDVTTKLVGTRDIYFPELKSGDVDVVPEYLGSFADFLNTTENGPNAEPVVSNDPQEELDAVKPMADSSGITLLEPAEASDQNAFAVTKEFAKQNNLTTLSDLGELGEPITLAGAPDCKGQKDCEAGLENVYGIDIEKILPLGFGTPQTIDSAASGESQLAEVGTTQGDLDESGLVILEDDQGIQAAENLIPAINTDFLNDHPDVADVLNPLADVLTTEDLADLNGQVSLDREKPEDVASQYLQEKGLL
ncbi:MAG TPA: ABC transporter substrate-binding protein [Nocardioidaceae bacterium]|nr:ABC transporter substrate-binding protein [Nocardioidaceae bacterium]